MSLIDPLQLMTLFGKTPERQQRKIATPGSQQANFDQQMHAALGQAEKNSSWVNSGGSAAENALLHDALKGLSSILGTSSSFAPRPGTHNSLGALAAQFESGKQGVHAIGYDRHGGTSYGTYQIASRPGTMNSFIEFLETKALQWAQELKAAGPANTGSKEGRMPQVWRKIATQAPEKFQSLQREFIDATHYQPALRNILAQTGINMQNMPAAMQEALWSTAVQHGPGGATKIFKRAIQGLSTNQQGPDLARQIINAVYDDRPGHFTSSTAQIQASARQRMKSERNLVLAMLENNQQQA